ncbi:MAG TPA: hypothetical protein VIE69_04865 [Methylophilaceae bacterium]|jgi:hypothetical protein
MGQEKMRALALGVLLTIMSLFTVQACAGDDQHQCGTDYPENFPCIAGGKVLKVNLNAVLPGVAMPKMAVVAYPQPYKNVFDLLVKNAESLSWAMQSHEDGKEPDGIRYRASFVQNQQKVSISVYQNLENKDWAMVQVMELAEVPAQ